jgi:addiction module RelE/StbE family toxin
VTIRWTPTALHDLESVHSYIATDNPNAALMMLETIVAGISALGSQPEMGRNGRIAGTRELVISPYVVAYRVVSRAKRPGIEVLAIIHGARRWPDSF